MAVAERRRKRQPGCARSPAKSQLVAVCKHRPMAVWGGRTGQLSFEFPCRKVIFKVMSESSNNRKRGIIGFFDVLGYKQIQINNQICGAISVVEEIRNVIEKCQSVVGRLSEISEKVFGATPKTATGTGALPGNVPVGGRAQAPANGSLGWTNGAKGVSILSREGSEGGEVRRTGIFVEPAMQTNQAPSERHRQNMPLLRSLRI